VAALGHEGDRRGRETWLDAHSFVVANGSVITVCTWDVDD
jgi:hypothetical protein